LTVLGEVKDSEAALQFLRAQQGVDFNRLGVLGFSLGGVVASYLSARVDELKSAAFWAPVADLSALLANILGDTPMPPPEMIQDYEHNGMLLSKQFLLEIPGLNPVKELARFRGDVLLIHGSDDTVVDPEHSRMYYSELESRKAETRMEIISGANHGFATRAQSEELLSLTADWFAETL